MWTKIQVHPQGSPPSVDRNNFSEGAKERFSRVAYTPLAEDALQKLVMDKESCLGRKGKLKKIEQILESGIDPTLKSQEEYALNTGEGGKMSALELALKLKKYALFSKMLSYCQEADRLERAMDLYRQADLMHSQKAIDILLKKQIPVDFLSYDTLILRLQFPLYGKSDLLHIKELADNTFSHIEGKDSRQAKALHYMGFINTYHPQKQGIHSFDKPYAYVHRILLEKLKS